MLEILLQLPLPFEQQHRRKCVSTNLAFNWNSTTAPINPPQFNNTTTTAINVSEEEEEEEDGMCVNAF